MKNEKGITLVSLLIYVIAMLVTITIISVMTSYFYQNIDVSNDKYTSITEYTRFNSYFSEEVNRKNNHVLEIVSNEPESSNQNFVAFSSGNQYTFVPQNKAIYQNNVKIASGVDLCQFENKIINGKEAIKTTIKIGDMEKTIEYILQN